MASTVLETGRSHQATFLAHSHQGIDRVKLSEERLEVGIAHCARKVEYKQLRTASMLSNARRNIHW
jgi:hypothetical protein